MKKKQPILLWESTREINLPDLSEKLGEMNHDRPMLIDLKERLQTNIDSHYYEVLGFRYLQEPLNETHYKKLWETICKVTKEPFPSNKDMFWNGITGGYFHKKENLKSFFCSELVAYTLMKIGLLDSFDPAQSYAPKDFSNEGIIPLCCRDQYAPEIRVGR